MEGEHPPVVELLAVPYEDRADFRRWSEGAASLGNRAGAQAAMGSLLGYIRELIDVRRRDAGNRDGRAFTDPARFDIARDRNPHLLTGGVEDLPVTW